MAVEMIGGPRLCEPLVNQLGALERFSTRELHQAARLLKATIQARPPAPRTPPPAPAPINPLDSDDRIEQGLAEHLPWMDLEIDLGITSPPYCLGLAIPYDEGGDYDDYDFYRDELLPRCCEQLFRVANPEGGRLCVKCACGRARAWTRKHASVRRQPTAVRGLAQSAGRLGLSLSNDDLPARRPGWPRHRSGYTRPVSGPHHAATRSNLWLSTEGPGNANHPLRARTISITIRGCSSVDPAAYGASPVSVMLPIPLRSPSNCRPGSCSCTRGATT